MENKYYTPDISEFHIGFEFEAHKDASIIEGQTEEWQATAVRYHDYWMTWPNMNMEKMFRVKYLDKADILECGWVQGADEEMPYFTKGKFILIFSERRISIHKGGLASGMQYFRGEAKNKSELKRLMAQLRIG